MTDQRPPSAPVRRTASTRSRGPGAVVPILVILAVGAAALVILALRPSPTSDARFKRTFSDSAGYAGTVARAGKPVVAAAPVARGIGTHRVLTMKGGWTSDIGRTIALRALKWVGTPYSWDGGDTRGPTLGKAVDEASRNDGHIVGFDCSGLVMYALAPYMTLTHFAAAQYVEAGQVHPTLNQLMPGDLVFWSSDGTIKGVGHVAVYIGGGKVVQAPHSGATVTVTPLDQVEAGAIGTTRPLTVL